MLKRLCNNICVVLVGLFCGFVLSACEQGGAYSSLELEKPFPSLVLKTIEGEPFPVERLKGQVIILKLWATWCKVCMETEPQFKAFIARFDSDNLVVASVSVDQDLNMLREYLMDHPNKGLQLVDQGMRQSMTVLGVDVIPQVFVIDKAGILRYQKSGGAQWGSDDFHKIQDILD
ncbi:MAG: cytochrome c biogenesis protein CcmG, thiol:disulfide interchange protein DsbE [Thiomicrorhabdus sp.]|nr:MAG: cytochrome c biogenesis protein CcmG, thiol:disulfide interchange protein DsbE [Thiomicrorhabdus sp.]